MPSWLISPLISAVLFALAAGGIWYEKNAYDERRWAEGRSQLQPALNAAVAQLKADTAAFATIEGYMTAITTKSAAVAVALTAAAKTNTNRKTGEAARVQYIERLVPVGATSCERTSDMIKKSLR